MLDASWHMDPARSGRDEFTLQRIPTAQYFDINEVADQASKFPHTFPPAAVQSAAARHFGLERTKQVVVYEAGSLFSAPRAWWTLKHMGFDVKIMAGGLQAWLAAGAEVDLEPREAPALESLYNQADQASCTPSGVIDFEDMQAIILSIQNQSRDSERWVLDARSSGRFEGTSPEPRPGIRSGHMPGSKNVPFTSLIAPETGAMLTTEELQAVFEGCGVPVTPTATYTTTCGSGVTAAVVLLALHECGVSWEKLQLYDGSWLEWASRGGSISPSLSDNTGVEERAP